MVFLIDEDVPVDVASFLALRQHTVYLVKTVLGAGSPDRSNVLFADRISAVVVTWNHKDYARLIPRRPPDNNWRYRHAGRLSFLCSHPRGQGRLEQFIELIEAEFQGRAAQHDRRVIAEISDRDLSIVR